MENYKGNESLASYCQSLIWQYNENMKRIVTESTDDIFGMIKNQTLELRRTLRNSITKGKFYLIRYNYNGNKLWCPIFVIDDRYNAELQKRIIYAVNFDYLPYRYKIAYMDKIFKMLMPTIIKNNSINERGDSVNGEVPLKVNFESIYKTLKDNGGFNFAITGFDYSKIVGMERGQAEIYGISTCLLPRFLFIDTKIVNSKIMMEAIKDSDIELEKLKLQEILDLYEQNVKDYDNDIKDYYQRLKLIENKYKLYQNIE